MFNEQNLFAFRKTKLQVNWGQLEGTIWIVFIFLPVLLTTKPQWLPSYFSNTFFLAMIIAIASGVFALFRIMNNKSLWGFTKIDIAVGLFTLYFLIRFVFSANGHWSQGQFVWWVALFALYFIFRIILSVQRIRNGIGTGLMLIALFQIILGQMQILNIIPSQHNLFTISGSFFNPAPYSGFLAIIFPIALFELMKRKSSNSFWKKTLGWLVVTGTLLVIIPAQSRAAWLALIVGSLFLLVNYFNLIPKLKKWSKSRLLVIILLSMSILGAAGHWLYELKPDSASGRLLIWKISSEMWQDKPLLGYGPIRFGSDYMLAQADYFASGVATVQEELLAGNVNFPYNEFLQIAVELGALGLLLFLGILAFALTSNISRRSVNHFNVLIPLKAALLAWIVFSWFSYPFSVWGTALLFTLLLVWLSANSEAITSPKWLENLRWVRVGGIFIFVSFIAFWSWRTYPAINDWVTGMAAYQFGRYEEAHKSFNQAFDALQYDGLYLQQFGKCLEQLGRYKDSNTLLYSATDFYNDPILYTTLGNNHFQLLEYKQAEKAFIRAKDMIPHRIYPGYLLTQLYYTTQDRKRAANLAKQLLEKSIKVHSTATNEMIYELKILSAIDY